MAALQKGSAKEKHVMHLLRSLWFFTAFYDINLQSAHIPGVIVEQIKYLHSNNMLTFFTSNPQANRLPTPLPHPFLVMVGATEPDWTSQAFRRPFHTNITKAWPTQPWSLTKQATRGTWPSAPKPQYQPSPLQRIHWCCLPVTLPKEIFLINL